MCLLLELPVLCEPYTQSKLVACHNNGTVESLESWNVSGSQVGVLKTQGFSVAVGVVMITVHLLNEISPRTVYLRS